MGDRIKVRQRSTGLVGTMERGNPGSFVAETAAPTKPEHTPFMSAVRTAGALSAAPMVKGIEGATRNLPDQAIQPALFSVAGGVAGQASGLPGGATLGGMAGQAVGETAQSIREFRNTGQADDDQGVARTLLAGAIPMTVAGGFRAAQGLGRAFLPGMGAKFANQLQSTATGFMRTAGEKIGGSIDELSAKYPDRVVDITKHLDELKTAIGENPALRQLITAGERKANASTLSKVLDGKVLPNQLTLKQAQEVKSAIDRVPGLSQRLRQGTGARYIQEDLPLLQFKEGVRSSQTGAFQELPEVFKGYRESRQAYDLVEPHLRPGRATLSGSPNFPPDPRVTLAARDVIGRSNLRQASFARAMENVRRPLNIFGKKR